MHFINYYFVPTSKVSSQRKKRPYISDRVTDIGSFLSLGTSTLPAANQNFLLSYCRYECITHTFYAIFPASSSKENAISLFVRYALTIAGDGSFAV